MKKYNVYDEYERLVVTTNNRIEANELAKKLYGYYESVRFESLEKMMESFMYDRVIGSANRFEDSETEVVIRYNNVTLWINDDSYLMESYNKDDIKSLYKAVSRLIRKAYNK